MIGGAVLLLALASLVRRPLRVKVATVATVIISGSSLGISLWQWSDVVSTVRYTSIATRRGDGRFQLAGHHSAALAMLLTALVADGYLAAKA